MSRKRKPKVDLSTVNINEIDPHELRTLVFKAGGQRKFSKATGIPRTTIQFHLNKIKNDQWGHRPAPQPVHVGQGGGKRRFILSSAQDMTRVHESFLTNLEAYAEWLRGDGTCEIMIGGFTYSKKLFTEHDPGQAWFQPSVVKYLTTDRMRIDDRIDFCAEMNTLPTATDPLSGLDTYTRSRWGIFPHAKVRLKSIATMKHEPAKIIMTTGTVTKPNYLPMKAGVKASFHHVYGAVLVEIDEDGTFFCRHILGEEEGGGFYDLDRRIEDGAVTEGHRIKTMTPGDLHVHQIDPVASKTILGVYPTEERSVTNAEARIWRKDTDPVPLIDFLRPEYLFCHDMLDFRKRNHHTIADPHDRFLLHITASESVEQELKEVGMFGHAIGAGRPWLQTVVVDSNHDQALVRWLKTADYRTDPVNAVFFLRAQLAFYEAMERRDKSFSIFETVFRATFDRLGVNSIKFLREDESFRVGGVEYGMHGHRGPNGARGSTGVFVKVASKITKGHGHSATIIDGVYEAGTTSKLDLGYNAGPSSWSHSLVIQYANDKRAIITLQNGKAHL